ncbi:MAG TPA: MarR family transcriptional regulator [Thermomicrobiales bacterium]|jgi:DNA-binding MarR family transcriptional regulator
MSSADVPDDPLSTFSLSIFAINGLLLHSGEDVTRPLGQSSARWQVLGRAGYQPQTVAQMAQEMGHARQSVQRIADVLAKEGLVAYRDNPADKRARLVELTPRGEKVLAAIYARDREYSRQLMAELDPEQLLAIAGALDGIARILAAHIERQPTRQEREATLQEGEE